MSDIPDETKKEELRPPEKLLNAIGIILVAILLTTIWAVYFVR